MKILVPLLALASLLTLSSCFGTPGGGYGPGGLYGPGGVYGPEKERKAYEQGFGFGRKDAQRGRKSNPLLYNNYYDSNTKDEFIRGYNRGYRKGSS